MSTMTASRVTAMMRELTLDSAKAEAARGMSRDQLRIAYRLSESEGGAIADRRLDLLHAMGVHEVTLMQFSRTFRFSIADRWRELAD